MPGEGGCGVQVLGEVSANEYCAHGADLEPYLTYDYGKLYYTRDLLLFSGERWIFVFVKIEQTKYICNFECVLYNQLKCI
jgi:hypothetical protein